MAWKDLCRDSKYEAIEILSDIKQNVYLKIGHEFAEPYKSVPASEALAEVKKSNFGTDIRYSEREMAYYVIVDDGSQEHGFDEVF